MTRLETEGITVVDGVEIDITIRGEENKANKTLQELKTHCGRIGQAFDEETPPMEVDLSAEYMPLMFVAWDSEFGGEKQ